MLARVNNVCRLSRLLVCAASRARTTLCRTEILCSSTSTPRVSVAKRRQTKSKCRHGNTRPGVRARPSAALCRTPRAWRRLDCGHYCPSQTNRLGMPTYLCVYLSIFFIVCSTSTVLPLYCRRHLVYFPEFLRGVPCGVPLGVLRAELELLRSPFLDLRRRLPLLLRTMTSSSSGSSATPVLDCELERLTATEATNATHSVKVGGTGSAASVRSTSISTAHLTRPVF